MIQYHVVLERDALWDIQVRVVWNFDARTGNPAKEAITALLTGIDGVNVATIRRYDATLLVAGWIRNVDFFMVDLLGTLDEDREVPIAVGLPDASVDVAWDDWNPPDWFEAPE